MAAKERLESAADEIERQLKACPDNRFQLALARMLATGLDDRNSVKRAETREKIITLGKAALPALPLFGDFKHLSLGIFQEL